MTKSDEIKVFISNRDSKCDECGEELGRKAWITLERDKGASGVGCRVTGTRQAVLETEFVPAPTFATRRTAAARMPRSRG